MTISRCRELLGEKGKSMTDQEIISYIHHAGVIADSILDVASKDLLTLNKKGFYDDR